MIPKVNATVCKEVKEETIPTKVIKLDIDMDRLNPNILSKSSIELLSNSQIKDLIYSKMGEEDEQV